MQPPSRLDETKLWTQTRSAVDQLIATQIRRELGEEVFTQETLGEGYHTPFPRPPLTEALQVALIASRVASQLARDYAAKLRGRDAMSWAQIFPLLGIDNDEDGGRPKDELAYEFILGPDLRTTFLLDQRYVHWECGACGYAVSDVGPYNGHPADNERGHAHNCVRHQQEISAYLTECEKRDGE